GGLGASHVDESGERIGAVYGPLGSMQHFDMVDIEQGRRHPESAEIDVIDQEAHRWIRSALILLQLADAANLEIARQRGIAGPIEVRYQRQYVLEILPAGIAQRGGVQYRCAAG